MTERQGIEIDYCPDCRGVWLDRGELDKIIERSVSPQENFGFNSQSRKYDDHEHGHHDYYKHRKKGWLGELFD
jgi:Zn-finger nucleic acid-binding protein